MPEIAYRMDYSERSIDRYICQIKKSLGASTSAHMIAIAFVAGLILLPENVGDKLSVRAVPGASSQDELRERFKGAGYVLESR